MALLRHFHGRYVPQLSFTYILDALEVDKKAIHVKGNTLVLSHKQKEWRIPINNKGKMLVRWVRGWKTQPWTNMISLITLLEYKEWKEYLKHLQTSQKSSPMIGEAKKTIRQYESLLDYLRNKVAIIGYTASATTDVGAIPFDPSAPRVMLQAHLMNTILMENFLYFANWWWEA